MFFRGTSFRIKLLFVIIMLDAALFCMNDQQSRQALIDITATIQNLAGLSNKLSPAEKPLHVINSIINPEFSVWDKGEYSVIQVHVLDQFLTTKQFVQQNPWNIQDIPNLGTIFGTNRSSEAGHKKEKLESNIKEITKLKEYLNNKIEHDEISPNLNIGGGEESCGYHAIKNAQLIVTNLETEPFVYLTLNDPLYANKLFGTRSINKIFNSNKTEQFQSAEDGPWRKIVIDHRIIVKEASITSNLKSAQNALSIIEQALEKLPKLIKVFNKPGTAKTEIAKEIQQVWENISVQENKISSNSKSAEQKSLEISTQGAMILASSVLEIDLQAKKILQKAKDMIPAEALATKTQTTEVEQGKSDEEEEDFDESEYEFEEDNDSDEEIEDSDDDSDKENAEPSEQENRPAFNLEQSEKEGNNLDVSDLDHLYETLKEPLHLPESTTIGTMELGVEPLEGGEVVDEDTANEQLNRIITEMTNDLSRKHIIFVGGGGHWATVVIRIINKKLYYIIADSSNDQRYGVDLKRKGIFITKAIQKIIDGTKDSLIRLIN